MAANLLLDHRISPERLRSFGATQPFTSIAEIGDQLVRYRKTQVCPAKDSRVPPAYLLPDNQNNEITGSPKKQLMTVLNLSYLGRAYHAADQVFKIAGFPRFEVNPSSTSEVTRWLTRNMPPEPDRAAFITLLLQARNRYQASEEDKYLHLTWAAEADSFRAYLSPDQPRRWLQGVGVRAEEPVWVAVLKYPSRQNRISMPLFRPTQIDCGWYPYHFPSPPQASLSRGGHTMFLKDADDSTKHPGLVDEYIHPSISFTTQHWRQAGELLDLVPASVGDELVLNREVHAQILTDSYGHRAASWLNICK